MLWNPKETLLHDVYKPYGGLDQAGLKAIGKQRDKLILKLKSGETKIVKPGEEIPRLGGTA
jgi:hypothetical protein